MKVDKLTLPFVKTITPPAKKQVFYFDKSFPRFCLCVYPSGRKTFMVKYQNEYGKPRWLKVGTFPIMTLEDARSAASELLHRVDKDKEDPAKTKKDKKNAKTVAELCDWYLEEGVGHKKQSTIKIDRSRIERHIKPLIGDEPIESITRGKIESMMFDIIKGDKISRCEKTSNLRGKSIVTGGKTAASRTIQLLGAIFKFAKNRDLIQNDNPAHGIRLPENNIKDTFLSLNDIATLGRVLNDPKNTAIYKIPINAIKLIALTGCRKSEITALRWEYVDFENQCFRFPDTKTGKQNRPFGIKAKDLLQEIQQSKTNEWVFPSTIGTTHIDGLLRIFKRLQQSTDENGNIVFDKPDVDLHTLRHTFATIANDIHGFGELTIAGLLGHKLARKSVTHRYTHLVDKSLVHAADMVSTTIFNALNGNDNAI